MENYPKTLLAFQEQFSTEEACRDYLFRVRWPNGIACPRCKQPEVWTTERGLYMCKDCGFQFSLTSGTLFEGTRKPLRLWFWAMWYITNQKHGVSALGLQRVLELGSYRTAWTWLHKLRVAMVRPGRDRLSGTVEIDETYIGGQQSGKRGRGASGKALVVIAVEDKAKHLGRIRLRRIPDASATSLTAFIEDCVEPGSVINTDGWNGYKPISSKPYTHCVIRGSAADDLTPLVHRVASLLKRWLNGTHQGAILPSHLDYYLDEFTFRFNRRTSGSRGLLFYRLITQAVNTSPIAGKDLKGD